MQKDNPPQEWEDGWMRVPDDLASSGLKRPAPALKAWRLLAPEYQDYTYGGDWSRILIFDICYEDAQSGREYLDRISCVFFGPNEALRKASGKEEHGPAHVHVALWELPPDACEDAYIDLKQHMVVEFGDRRVSEDNWQPILRDKTQIREDHPDHRTKKKRNEGAIAPSLREAVLNLICLEMGLFMEQWEEIHANDRMLRHQTTHRSRGGRSDNCGCKRL